MRPGLDDKRLTSWNALAISALAEAGAVLGREDFLDAARAAAGFLLETMRDADGRLLRTYNRGRAKLGAYLEDHAYLRRGAADALRGDVRGALVRARAALADETIERFGDPERGGFFTTADDHEKLVARRKDIEDTPIPAGASAIAFGLLRLAALTGEHAYEEQALTVLRPLREPIASATRRRSATCCRRSPSTSRRSREVALVGDDLRRARAVVRSAFRPARGRSPAATAGAVPLLEGRTPVDGRAAAYVCERFACRAPVTEPADLAVLLSP